MKETKKVTASVSEECHVELKVLALRRKMHLEAIVAEVLEKAMKKHIKNANSAVPVEPEEG